MLKLYRIKLKSSLVPATTAENAFNSHLQLQNNMTLDQFNIHEEVCGEDTFKLLTTARMLLLSEKFEADEVVAMVEALAAKMGYFNSITFGDVRELICFWVERFDDLDDDEFMDWLNQPVG